MKSRYLRFFWPSVAVLSMVNSAYLWRSNLLLQTQIARWRAERVTTQVAAYQASVKSNPLSDKTEPTKSTPLPSAPETSPKSPNGPEGAEKALVDRLKSEVVVSYGSVEQMGSGLASFFASQQARKLRSQAGILGAPDQALTAEETAQGQRELAEVMGMLPEIEKFQDQPSEYGRFFKGLFQAGGALTEVEVNRVEALMKQRATEGINQGVNAGNKPAEGQWAWEMKRDTFNEETAEQLKSILPAKAQETFPVDGPLMEFLEMDFDAAGFALPKSVKQ